MFTEGQKVKCIDNMGMPHLVLGAVYTVGEVGNNTLFLKEFHDHGYFYTRFRELTMEEVNELYKGHEGQSASTTQVGGSHYKDMVIQPIDFILANGLGYCEANVVKYICRHEKKNGLQDLEKAKHYIDLIIEKKYKNKKP